MRFCHHCGQALRGEERFCGACGREAVREAATTGPAGTAGGDDETVSVPANPYADLDADADADAEAAPPRGRRVALVSGAVAAILLAGGVSAYALTRGSEPGGSAAPATSTATTTTTATTATAATPAPTAPPTTPAASATRAPGPTRTTPQAPVTVTVPGARRTVTATPSPSGSAADSDPGGTDNDDENTGTAADDGTNLPFYDLGSSHLVFASLPKDKVTLAQARRHEAGLGGGVTTIDSDVAPWLRHGYWAVVSARSYPTGAEALRHCADHGRAPGGECYARKVHR